MVVSTRNWDDHVARVVQEIEEIFGVYCNTYDGHGATGEWYGIDIWISDFGVRANAEREALGDKIQNWLDANWRRLGIHYIIYWGSIWYSPYDYAPYDSGGYWVKNNSVTEGHYDHIHVQITVPNLYSPAVAIRDSHVATIDKHLGNGRIIAEEARNNGLDLALACALVDQESEGLNIFGCDHGDVGDRPPYCHQEVTRQRVNALIDNGNFGHGMNGIGLTQITWWTFVMRGERAGGIHHPRVQCRIGFGLLKYYLNNYPYLEALGAYNAGEESRQVGVDNGYAGSVAEKHKVWKQRLADTKPTATFTPHLVAVGKLDAQVAFLAAAVLADKFAVGIKLGADSIKQFDTVFSKEPLGTRQMIVVGGPAHQALLDKSLVLYPADLTKSDYIGAVGKNYADTIDRLSKIIEKFAGTAASNKFKSLLKTLEV